MKKILYITTVSSTINSFLIPHIKMHIKKGFKVDCACYINRDIDKELLDNNTKIYNIPFSRNPLSPKNLKAFYKLINIQRENKYDIIHVHTPVASIYGRLLKLIYPNIKTIYTAHGFHFYDGAPMLNWIIYYPIERVMANLTDMIITINDEDYERAKLFNIKETYKINGVGVDLSKYSTDCANKIEVRKKLNLNEDDFVITMIAEVNKNKNHKQMIDAIKILTDRGINNIKVICAGEGPILDKIKSYIDEMKLQNNIKMLGYRNDINELIVACDIGILMSYREGLPKNIMELMACGKPVIGTDIRGIRDLIEHNVNGYLVNVGDSEATADKIEKIYREEKILKNMSLKANEIIKDYSVEKIINQLEGFYGSVN